MKPALVCLSVFLLFTSCCTQRSAAYREPFFIVFLVNAPHLDYTDNKSFLRTMAKHPDTGCKDGSVGHAWVYLHGVVNDKCYVMEGGHSGERGILQPRYFEGLVEKVEGGCENPISYLWECQNDGFFQVGNGGHRPTFAAKVNLTEDEFWKVVRFVQHYPFSEYALTGNQCASFVAQIGQLINFEIECQQKVKIEPVLCLSDGSLVLWTDPVYAEIMVSTPDVVEKSLMEAVKEGKAEPVLRWYTVKFRNTFKRRSCLLLPEQLVRYWYFSNSPS